MNKAEIIEQVKNLLFGNKMKFAETKLEDGTTIYTDGDSFEVGSEVYTLDEQGNKVPVFDAEHKLEDGTIVATVGGKVTEIKPVEDLKKDEEMGEKEKMEEVDVEDDIDVEDEEMKEEKQMVNKMSEEELLMIIGKLEARIAALEGGKEDLKKVETKLSKVESATIYLAEEFSKTPGGEKIDVKPTGYMDQFKKTTNREDRLRDLMKTINTKEN